MTIKELKKYLGTLPESFDEFSLVNGEVGSLGDETVYRLDKPIMSLTIDEETHELCLLHQTDEEIKIIEE